jgi:hypothetical protein
MYVTNYLFEHIDPKPWKVRFTNTLTVFVTLEMASKDNEKPTNHSKAKGQLVHELIGWMGEQRYACYIW